MFKGKTPAGVRKKTLLLTQHQSPGDVLVCTTVPANIHAAYPGEYLIGVDTYCMEIWANNPHITQLNGQAETSIRMHCHGEFTGIHHAHLGTNYVRAFNSWVEKELRRPIPVRVSKPQLYFSQEELDRPRQVTQMFGWKRPYAVILSGGKQDYVTKHLGTELAQSVVDAFPGVQFVQVGHQPERNHRHPPLRNVLDLVGKTTVRELMLVCHHASFAVCNTTFVQHIMAALGKPAVVCLGGRENPEWCGYIGHRNVGTVGLLPCCQEKGCWKARPAKIGDGDDKDRDDARCVLPVLTQTHNGPEYMPKCMLMIKDRVIGEIKDLITNGMVNT